ncbi:DNA recombination protein RmuC [Helcobacillus massiliensis]|uniref:DNA recombination protein RmuC n=1 Tax=Helcobacillus massiliensis TaxID=521392 RepID=A0A839QT88_9MICO|nr:DNA recombination protein RmuC [Helcobacillus massiliensis]MBB3022858.1 DNA recombination protein RmuC [Helcobacillus massiliensis]
MDMWIVIVIGIAAFLLGIIAGSLWSARTRSRAGEEQVDVAAIAAKAAQESSQQLLALTDERYSRDHARTSAALAPIGQSLEQLQQSVARTEAARSRSEGDLTAQLRRLSQTTADLTHGTAALTSALKAPSSRGQWGEVQLQRIVEAAGMLEHTDFSTQARGRSADGDREQRPDLVVHLSQGRSIVVDAKAPMDSFLRAVDAQDPSERAAQLQAHARALRMHVSSLSAKSYWAGLGDAPEFVVLFVPSDGVLAAALEADPGLLDGAFTLDVVIASPATLMALLRTVAHTWRTDALNRDALEVLSRSRELHKRLTTMGRHFTKLGRSLDGTVKTFNDVVGSYQSRVMPTARSIEELAAMGKPLAEPGPVTSRARELPRDTGDSGDSGKHDPSTD